jgi:hypothetical protein
VSICGSVRRLRWLHSGCSIQFGVGDLDNAEVDVEEHCARLDMFPSADVFDRWKGFLVEDGRTAPSNLCARPTRRAETQFGMTEVRMQLGLKVGSRGPDVQRLHRVLATDGHEISKDEIESSEFGQSTLEKLHAFQSKHRLGSTDFIDQLTLDVLIEVEKQNVFVYRAVDPDEPSEQERPGGRGEVSGTLVDGDGLPVANTKVTLFEKELRIEYRLGDGTTNSLGAYSIRYARHAAVNLLVRAYDDNGKKTAQSTIAFAAPADVTLDFTTAADGIVRSPSRFAVLQNGVISVPGKTV